MDRDASRPGVPAAKQDETSERVREIDRRALMLGAAVAGVGVTTLLGGAQTADAAPAPYVRLGNDNATTSTTSVQTSGGTGLLGVQDNASGLLTSTALIAGVAGDSDAADGVLGASSASNGVHGICSADGGSGVLGADTSTTGGYGAQGSSTNGIGVLAISTNGTALKVNGPAQLTSSLSASGPITGASLATSGAVSAGSLATTGAVSAGSLTATGAVSAGSLTTTGPVSAGALAVTGKLELHRSGVATVAAHRKSVKVSVPGVTNASLVIATIQGASGEVAVASAAARDGSFTIHLTGAHPKKLKVAWFVIN
jgi:hypothetical protein